MPTNTKRESSSSASFANWTYIHFALIIFIMITPHNVVVAQQNPERMIGRMKMDDRNGDGNLTKSEFTGPEQMFRRLDADKDGIVIIEDVAMDLNVSERRISGSQREQVQIQPDYVNVKYGEHERQGFDVYLAKKEGEDPAPLFIWIHGGGFRNGDKSQGARFARHFIDEGITYISLNYRLSHQDIAPACFHDCARALQFIRYNAGQWNIDTNRIAAGGGSAGSGLAQWLAFNPDLSDPEAEDPVLRESSRVNALVLFNAQISYDPRWIKEHIPGEAWRDQALQELYDHRFSR